MRRKDLEPAVKKGILTAQQADRLVEFLAAHEVEDLAIGRPDLESLFRRFYEGKSTDSR